MSVGTPFVEAVHRASAECSDRIFVRQSLALLALEDLRQRQRNKAPAQREAEQTERRPALEARGELWQRPSLKTSLGDILAAKGKRL